MGFDEAIEIGSGSSSEDEFASLTFNLRSRRRKQKYLKTASDFLQKIKDKFERQKARLSANERENRQKHITKLELGVRKHEVLEKAEQRLEIAREMSIHMAGIVSEVFDAETKDKILTDLAG